MEISTAGDGDDRQEGTVLANGYMPVPRVAAVSGLAAWSRREAAERALQTYLQALADDFANQFATTAASDYS